MEYQLLALFIFAIYMIPTIIASRKKHKNLAAIATLNVVAGWSGIGWIAALIWSLTDGSKPKSQVDEMRELLREMKELQEQKQ